jgi:hypothetical protein
MDSWWWLRSPGDIRGSAANVDYAGYIGIRGNNVYYFYGSVRPALWLKLQ